MQQQLKATTPCAGGDHFVVCIPLRVVLPLVGTCMMSSNHRANRTLEACPWR